MENKFNKDNLRIGDRVRIISKKSGSLNGFGIGEEVEITNNENYGNYKYQLKKLEEDFIGYANEEDLQLIAFQVGDKVKVRLDCTLADIFEDNSHGCLNKTMDFIESDRYKNHKTYEVEQVNDKGNVILCDCEYHINSNIFELVERKENIKEMTVEETSKGYEVKIVKGE